MRYIQRVCGYTCRIEDKKITAIWKEDEEGRAVECKIYKIDDKGKVVVDMPCAIEAFKAGYYRKRKWVK